MKAANVKLWRDKHSQDLWSWKLNATLLVTVLIASVGEALPEMMQSIPKLSDSKLYGVDACRKIKKNTFSQPGWRWWVIWSDFDFLLKAFDITLVQEI